MSATREDFFKNKNITTSNIFITEGVIKLAFLCDIFDLLNKLNLLLQVRMTTVFKVADRIAAFKSKL